MFVVSLVDPFFVDCIVFEKDTTHPSQHFNVGNNVYLTLKMKQNPTSDFQRCTTLIHCQCSTLKQCQYNVARRCFHVDKMFHSSVDVSENYIESNWASDYGFANRLIIFILLNQERFFTI